jgi:hypothetical protein
MVSSVLFILNFKSHVVPLVKKGESMVKLSLYMP